jgi:hypothetical protein
MPTNPVLIVHVFVLPALEGTKEKPSNQAGAPQLGPKSQPTSSLNLFPSAMSSTT